MVWLMKAFGREIFPGHLDPIQRDLLIVLMVGFAIAIAFISVGFVMFH